MVEIEMLVRCWSCRKWFTAGSLSGQSVCPKCGGRLGVMVTPAWLDLILEWDGEQTILIGRNGDDRTRDGYAV
jgi:DNA-directed RNA polymerase subunit RPC12/RpoP